MNGLGLQVVILLSTATPSQHGIKGIPNINNDPGFRSECKSGWVYDNKLWVFGEQTSQAGRSNDMWTFDLATNLWTWVAGPDTSYGISIYKKILLANRTFHLGEWILSKKVCKIHNNIKHLYGKKAIKERVNSNKTNFCNQDC